MIILNTIKNDWNSQRLIIENVDGEYQISLSDIIKNSINIFNDKNYKKILDLGCGTGRNSLFFAQHGFEVFASDIYEKPIGILRDKVNRKNILSKDDLSYGLGKAIEENTFIGSREGEEGIPHHYTDIKELKKTLEKFHEVNIYTNEYIIDGLNGKEYCSKVFDVIAFK